MNILFRRGVFVVLGLFLAWRSAPAQSIIQVIPLPGTPYWSYTWGLAADSSRLYIATTMDDPLTERTIYAMDFSGAVVDSTTTPAWVVDNQGLAIDASGDFYYVRRYTAQCMIVKLSHTGELLDSLRLPYGVYVGGVAWDGSQVCYSVY